MGNRTFAPDIVDQICEQLEEGKSLVVICRGEGMPTRTTVYRWLEADDELAARLRWSREVGFHYRAEMAVAKACAAEDPHKGRIILESEKWYLGKLSNAFREKPLVGVAVNVGDSDTFAAFAGALEEARAARAGLADSTKPVALPSPAGPADAAGGLADLAGAGGPRVGENADGC